MSLSDFVSSLPKDWATCPIYRKGVELPSGKKACGKSPLGRAHHDKLAPSTSLHYLNQSPEVYGAIGVFSGPRSNGLVILDIDANLGQLQKKHGADLHGPHVLSPRKNAAKFLFVIPQSLWTEISDVSLSASAQGFEVLWGRQALVCGEYAKGGTYTPKGDFNALPEAPTWLLEHMRESFRIKQEGKSTKAISDSRYAGRSREERTAIAENCLKFIPHQGKGSEDIWWRIGAAIHSELPGDDGLKLWTDWSKEDPEYAQDWENGDPCADRWSGFSSGKGIGFGTLIAIADTYDPDRKRLERDGLKPLMDEIEAQTLQIRQSRLSYDDVISRGLEIYEGDDVARMNFELHQLGLEAGYKDQSGVEKLLIDHITQSTRGEGYTMDKRRGVQRSYLIPGLLPSPYTVLFYGMQGCGKSATALALIKHVVDGIPFQLKHTMVPVKKGKAIYFSADMSEEDFENEFEMHEIRNQGSVRFEPGFNLYRQMQFVKTMNKVKPSLIVIDSLSSCSGAKAGDENKAEFAQPLYWLNTNNGTLWPSCSIVILHHQSKGTGSARGSTAIEAAVAEVWKISEPAENSGFTADQRLIKVGKSRIGRKGELLVQTQNDDLTLSMQEVSNAEERQTRAGTVGDAVMNRLDTCRRQMTIQELLDDPLIKGSEAAVRKTLQRLVSRGVVEAVDLPREPGQKGKPIRAFQAVMARAQGESVWMSSLSQNPVDDSKLNGTLAVPEESCPIYKGSAGAASDTVETESFSPRAWDEHDEFWD